MYSDLSPVFLNRSFGTMAQPGLRLSVERLSWAACGGPEAGRLTAQVSGLVDLDQFSALLRCGVVVYSRAGRAVWWGMVQGVRVQDQRAGVWLTLDDLTNRARVIYGKLEPEATAGGVRTSTSWADGLTSQAIYGVKENQYEMNLSAAAQAAAFRDQNLAKYKRISPRPVVGLGSGGSTITIDLVGFWFTLDWRFYSNAIGLIENVNRLPQHLVNVCVLAGERFAQSITISDGNWRVESIWFCVRRCNAGSTITVSLCADSAGAPGTILASSTLNGATLSKAARWTRFVLSSPVVVAAGNYWITFRDNTNNNYKMLVDYTLGYAGGGGKIYSSGV